MKHKHVHPRVIDSPNLLRDKATLLLGRSSRQLRRSCAGADTMCRYQIFRLFSNISSHCNRSLLLM